MSNKIRNVTPTFDDFVIRIRPYYYVHILDTNTNIVSLVIGPKKHTCLEHEKVVFGPEKMVMIPPRHYVVIDNPALFEEIEDEEGNITKQVMLDEKGQVLLSHGDSEVRFNQDPFPLYPGESLNGSIKKLRIVPEGSALLLNSERDVIVKDQNGHETLRKAGKLWHFKGPGTYYPQTGVSVVREVAGQILAPNQALRLRAKVDTVDLNGVRRKAGEEYIVRFDGIYLPYVTEEIVCKVEGVVLTNTRAIHVKALSKFEDQYGERKAGSEWLITNDDCDVYIPNVNVEITNYNVPLTVLTPTQYCVISDPVSEEGKPLLGTRKYIKGPATFFLKPGEHISNSHYVKIISAGEAYEVLAKESFYDESARKNRRPGDKWLIKGPMEYWPTLETEIVRSQTAVIRSEILNIYLFSSGPIIAVILLLIALYWFF
eukprot:TRINITY_DN13295_c0_g1_i1.p1 TRINITY_DN13295_c0_g1~~TRINITY_DN13295_c0_g1_i1.p1  ORF type:complete len:429 (-),score=88.48 TRINITY_DN13295_c0_g1_i1:25-1311(-)